MPKYQKPKGTRDLDEDITFKFEVIRSLFLAISRFLDYSHVEIPIFEKTELFERSTGESSEIVTKQMYKFQDKKNRELALRPEGTPGLIRAAIENNWLNNHNGDKFSYFGPFFRYERPQKGRYRQFFQLGAESTGSNNVESDAESIYFLSFLLKELEIKHVIKLNSLGEQEERLRYVESLQQWLTNNKTKIAEEDCINIEKNPLRILDSKKPATVEGIKKAPRIHEFWSKETSNRFKQLTNLLEVASVNYQVDEFLVRGLDYYTSTVFEASGHDGAQDAYGGGGRYNNLISELGGKNIPAIGFACGVDRIASALKVDQIKPFCIFVPLGEKCREKAFGIISKMWSSSISVKPYWNESNLGKALKRANSVGSKYVIVFGTKEMQNNTLLVKNMKNGDQKEIPLNIPSIISALGLDE
tara:strand:+ start:2492 stop:3736 length:1245 start_codon:yes stop_codon:yes gene_type:complete